MVKVLSSSYFYFLFSFLPFPFLHVRPSPPQTSDINLMLLGDEANACRRGCAATHMPRLYPTLMYYSGPTIGSFCRKSQQKKPVAAYTVQSAAAGCNHIRQTLCTPNVQKLPSPPVGRTFPIPKARTLCHPPVPPTDRDTFLSLYTWHHGRRLLPKGSHHPSPSDFAPSSFHTSNGAKSRAPFQDGKSVDPCSTSQRWSAGSRRT
jgi:hypothetical protein